MDGEDGGSMGRGHGRRCDPEIWQKTKNKLRSFFKFFPLFTHITSSLIQQQEIRKKSCSPAIILGDLVLQPPRRVLSSVYTRRNGAPVFQAVPCCHLRQTTLIIQGISSRVAAV